MAGGGNPAAAQNPAAMSGARPNVFNQSASAYTGALNGTQGAMQYAAYAPVEQATAATYNADQMAAARQFADTDLDPYWNPYQSNVIDQTQADMERSRMMQQNNTDAAAQAARAFGGSRHGIANAETNRNYYDRLGSTLGGLRHQGYTNAQGAAFQDIGNEMNVNANNMQATNAARAANAAAQTQVSMANAAAENAATQARINNLFGGASQLGSLSNLGFGMGQDINRTLARDGAMQQGAQQAVIDSARGRWDQHTGAPGQSLSYPLAAIGAVPVPQSTTTSQKNGIGSILSAGIGMFGPSGLGLL
jgi:hypothetical protein